MRKNTERSKIISSEKMRSADRAAAEKYLIPSIVLMENAGRCVAEEVLKLHPKSVVIFCGGGNNGGDGFVAARHIFNNGVNVRVVLLKKAGEYSGDALLNLKIIKKLKISVADWKPGGIKICRNELVVDALLGTGTKGDIRYPYKQAVEIINSSKNKVLSVDIPSGIDADTGFKLGAAVQADITITMAAVKKGLLKNNGKKCSGKIIVADISIPEKIL